MYISDFLDLDTFVESKKAAPIITSVPFDFANRLCDSLETFSRENELHTDQMGRRYWQTTVKNLHKMSGFSEAILMAKVGGACRSMGLVAWRRGDGYHVAWSEEQLVILRNYFNPQ